MRWIIIPVAKQGALTSSSDLHLAFPASHKEVQEKHMHTPNPSVGPRILRALERTRHDDPKSRPCIKLYIFDNIKEQCRLKPEWFITESEWLNRLKFGELLKFWTSLTDCYPHDGLMVQSDHKSKFYRYAAPLSVRAESTLDSTRVTCLSLCRVT
jgi:hypothetical protein